MAPRKTKNSSVVKKEIKEENCDGDSEDDKEITVIFRGSFTRFSFFRAESCRSQPKTTQTSAANRSEAMNTKIINAGFSMPRNQERMMMLWLRQGHHHAPSSDQVSSFYPVRVNRNGLSGAINVCFSNQIKF